MSDRYLLMVSAIAVGLASPTFATVPAPPAKAPSKPAAAVPATAASGQNISRVNLIKNRDNAFKKIDSNGDGVVTAGELANAEAAVSRARLEAEFDRLDTNHDGNLSKAEFLAASPPAASLEAAAQRTIGALDKNHDGKLTADEFRAPQLAVFDRLDTNHDGLLTPAERQAARNAAAARKR